jgi:hypothetical protein
MSPEGKLCRQGRSRRLFDPYHRSSDAPQKNNNKLKVLQRAKTLSSHRIFGPADVLDAEVFNRHWQPTTSGGGVVLQVSRVRPRALVAKGGRL